MQIRMTTTIGAAAVIALVAGTASAQFWTSTIGDGLTDGISNNGVASGQFGTPNGQYFTWTVGDGTQYIGGVSAGNGAGGQGKISDDGRYISGSIYNAAEDWHEMARYDRNTGTWEGFGMIPGIGTQVDASVSSGWGVSGDGNHVVGLGWTTQGTADTHAMQWTAGVGITDLGSATVGNSARANAVNFDGTVVAGWQDGAGRQGAVWVNGVQELIFDNTGGVAQEALAVSSDGQFVTGIGLGGFFDPATTYRYDTVNDTYQEIANLAVGAESRMAGAAISGDGSMIGGGTWGFGPATFGNAFIWEDGVGTMDFSDYLDGMGIAYDPNFHFAFISDISEDGQWITGWGNFGTPATTTSFYVHVPTPASAVLLGLGGLVATRRRR